MKGQASMEFMTMVSALGIISLVSFSVVYNSIASGSLGSDLSEVCSELALKINNALFFGDGFSQTISTPDKINGQSYTIFLSNSAAICRSGKNSYIKKFFAANLTNSTHTEFYIPAGR